MGDQVMGDRISEDCYARFGTLTMHHFLISRNKWYAMLFSVMHVFWNWWCTFMFIQHSIHWYIHNNGLPSQTSNINDSWFVVCRSFVIAHRSQVLPDLRNDSHFCWFDSYPFLNSKVTCQPVDSRCLSAEVSCNLQFITSTGNPKFGNWHKL